MSIPDPEKVAARFSMVERRLWNDVDGLSPIPPCGVGLWVYLLTSPYGGVLPGLIVAGQAMLAEHLGWSVEDFRAAWDELERKGMVRADWKARVIVLPKALAKAFDRKKPESPNVIKGWRTQWLEVPNCSLKGEYFATLSVMVIALGESFEAAFVKAMPAPPPVSARDHELIQQAKGLGKAFGEGLGKALAEPFSIQEKEKEKEEAHTPRAHEAGPAPADPPSPAEPATDTTPSRPDPPEDLDTAAVLAELRRHKAIVTAADGGPMGRDAALLGVAEVVSGIRQRTGRPIEQVLGGVREAGDQLLAEAGGATLQWRYVSKKVSSFAANARPLRAESAPAGQWSADEQALVALYVEAQRKIRKETVPSLDLHYAAARRLLPELRKLVAHIAEHNGGWTPTVADVARHKLRAYMKVRGQDLAEQGYPLALLLARTDAADLPARPRQAATNPPSPEPPPEPAPSGAHVARRSAELLAALDQGAA